MKIIMLALLAICSEVAIAENPFDETKYALSFSYLYNPKVFTKESNAQPTSLTRSFGGTFLVDLPIYRFLHSGYVIRYLLSPKDGDVGGILDLSGVVKPLIGFSSGIGHVAIYGMVAAGLSVTFLPIQNAVFSHDDGTPNFERHVHAFGGLVNAFSKVGVEYFPAPLLGIFVEAGYNYWYFLHQVNDKIFEPRFKFFSYHLTGISFDAGIRYVF